MKTQFFFFTPIIVLSLLLGIVVAPSMVLAKQVCFLFVCWDDGSSPPPPPPPPPTPEIQIVCDGKNLPRFKSFGETPCTDINKVRPGEVFTIIGRNFSPNSKYTEYGFRNAQGSAIGGEFLPYSNKAGDVFVNADANGGFVALSDVSDSFGKNPYFPYGTYPFMVIMAHYDSQKGSVKEKAVQNVTIGARVISPSPTPQPTPQPPTPPSPPPLPSGGNCDTSFKDHILHVCFFDGTTAPTTASPTLEQYNQVVFPSPVTWSQGFLEDWKNGVVSKTGKSDKVSAVWRGRVNFKEGIYHFHTKSDDGVELEIDNAIIIQNWNDHSVVQNDSDPILLSGFHKVKLRWYENEGGALASVWWDWDSITPTPKPEPKPEPKPVPEPLKPAVLGINPQKARPGDTVTLTSWPGFSNNVRVNVYFDDVRLTSVYLSPDLPQISIPNTATNGVHSIKITNFDGLGVTLSGQIEIYGGKDIITQTLVVNPSVVLPGDPITIKGTGWSVGEKTLVLTTLDEKKFNVDELGNRCPASTGTRVCGEGNIFYVAKIPQRLSAGIYYLMAFGNGGKERASFEIKILVPKTITNEGRRIVLNPTSGKAGMAIVVTGVGFKPNAGLLGKFDAEKLELGRGAGLLTDEHGGFSTIISIPSHAKQGKHTVGFSTGVSDDGRATTQTISGSYRCFRASGAENCRTLSPIVLNADGTYSLSSERGTYSIQEGKLFLSESKLRGAGTFSEDNLQVEFKYLYNGLNYDIVYLWEDLNNPPVFQSHKTEIGDSAEADFTVTEEEVVPDRPIEPKKDSSSREDIPMKSYGGVVVPGYGDYSAPLYGDVPVSRYGDETSHTYGNVTTTPYKDVPTRSYNGVETKSYGDVPTENYGDIKTNSYGNVPVPLYGNVTTTPYKDVPTRSYNGVETKSYNDVPIRRYDIVPAPTYEAPKTTPSGCNPNIPLYSQPGECRSSSYLNERFLYSAGLFDSGIFKFLRSLLGGGGQPQQIKSEPVSVQTQPKISPPISSKVEIKSKEAFDKKPILRVDVQPIPKKEIPVTKTLSSTHISGSYRCWQYNVSGGGGSCRTVPPLILKKDGTYSMSSELGTYRIVGDQIILSESKLRGPGTLLEENNQIRFEYDYKGWHHVVTYLLEKGVEPSVSKSVVFEEKYVDITLHIVYPEGDYSADSVNTVTLYAKDGGEQVAQSLAYATDRSTTEVWFGKRPPKMGLLAGKVYVVEVSSGFGEWKVGELDLRNITKDSTITINASPE